MGNLEDVSPHEARGTADFIAAMQRLKDLSGLTYRELEERATRNGDVLARSTLSDLLRRTSLPRPDVLAAFVRACGDGRRVDAWLDARNRIAADAAAVPPEAPDPEAQPHSAPSTGTRPRRTKSRTFVLVAGLVAALFALAAWELLPDDTSDDRDAATSPSGAPADGWVTIRPVRTPMLCLTDGRDREGAYGSAVAVQLPCAQATVPRTYLDPVGEGLYRIQWHHPDEGKGCLTVLNAGPVKGMLEPRIDCSQGTLFRLEPAADTAEGFRLRSADTSRCIGIADNDSSEGAEAIEEPCADAADQRFVIRTD